MSNDQVLTGRSALVTGAGRGIGKGIAIALADAGCRVIVNYLDNAGEADEAVEQIRRSGGDAIAVQGDVRVVREVDRMLEQVTGWCERLDILVNNAGIQTWTPLLDVTEEEWDRVIATNLKGCFLCTQAAARRMKDHGRGVIINIGSGCNKIAFPRLVAYTASKGGIEMLTKVAALELGPLGIRVNCVAPGAVEVERTLVEDPNYGATWGRVTPLRRVGLPDDIASAVVFLASDAASFVSGQTLWVDGGLFSQPPWAYGS